MWVLMALSKAHSVRRSHISAPPAANPEVIARQVRVEEIRRLVAKGAYKVNPQRMALKILVKSLGLDR
jgi:anti-sigma28 factor (negative regulator of flagellin synthesis)